MKTFEQWEQECIQWLKTRPCCDVCLEPIQDSFAFEDDGLLVCQNCANDLTKELQTVWLG